MLLSEFARSINPVNTILLLGAGASVPCGGKTGVDLARFLCQEVSDGDVESDDLAEATSLLEASHSRRDIVDCLAGSLRNLRPDGAMAALPGYPWARIYTTNYDLLVETAYSDLGMPLTVVRAMSDFPDLDKGTATELLKLHGCITRDRAWGNQDSMVLTEQDYDEYANYREALWAKLAFDLHTKDVLILGQSLKDEHLRRLIADVSTLSKNQGGPRKVFSLLYDTDEGRVRLLESRNIRASSGTLSSFFDLLGQDSTKFLPRVESAEATDQLPLGLRARTRSVYSLLSHDSDPIRLYNGGAAEYGDVAAGLTFPRSNEGSILEGLADGTLQYAVLLGVAGVGKTTLARRVMAALQSRGIRSYEHAKEYPFEWKTWLEVARSSSDSAPTVLFVDDAAKHLTGLNRLARALEEEGVKHFRFILAAPTGQWAPRSKSACFNRYGREYSLSKLLRFDIENLVDLCTSEPSIRALVDSRFLLLSRRQQIRELEDRCDADMYVALKNCFSSDGLDKILLAEFAELGSDDQAVYHLVAMLESTYANVSRQLVLDVLDMNWDQVAGTLDRLQGIINQRTIDERDGVYVWETRHAVIAQTIAWYKGTDQDELFDQLQRVIRCLHSSVLLDREIIPNLCDREYAIGRITDPLRRIELLQQLVARSKHRVPWHRLISAWLEIGDLGKADRAIKDAEEAVHLDSPIARYKVRLLLRRADDLAALGTGDELALIYEAETMARAGLMRWPDNKYSYRTFADVAEALWDATGDNRLLREARTLMSDAYEATVLDPDLAKWRLQLDRILSP